MIIGETAVDEVGYLSNSISVTADKSRGMIYDCKGRPLVCESTVDMIAVKPSLDAFKNSLSNIVKEDKNAVFGEISAGRIGIGRAVSEKDSDDYITFKVYPRYTDNGLCVHLIGYTDTTGNGVSGLEKYYNSILNEGSGSLKIICGVDALSHPLAGEKLSVEKQNYAQPSGVSLTIDRDIQLICEQAAELFEIETGAVVVLDVNTCEIRALASFPEYSQNNPAASLNDSRAPFINRAVTPYSVGSVFKAVVAAAAIENGIKTDFSFECRGAFKIGNNIFRCHNRNGHGLVDMFSATVNSCNPYFINLALNVGKDRICEMGKNLGLGTQIELCDGWYSSGGIMPDADSLVSDQDIANIAFGQGKLLASPLQMAAVYAAIANGGIYRAPSLMKSIIDKNGEEIMAAELPAPRRVMHTSTAETVGKLLNKTAELGSSGKANTDGFSSAGKTATAQSGQFDENGKEITQSWFCGYFPYENPKYAVTVLKENGVGGSADCAPVFKYIAEKTTELNRETEN